MSDPMPGVAAPPIDLPIEKIRFLCRKHGVRELYLFGSALRDELKPDSDLDFLVAFHSGAEKPWLGHFQELQADLSNLLGRHTDVVSKGAIEQSRNWIRRREILGTARLLYAA